MTPFDFDFDFDWSAETRTLTSILMTLLSVIPIVPFQGVIERLSNPSSDFPNRSVQMDAVSHRIVIQLLDIERRFSTVAVRLDRIN